LHGAPYSNKNFSFLIRISRLFTIINTSLSDTFYDVEVGAGFIYSAQPLNYMSPMITLDVETNRITRKQFIIQYLERKGIRGAYVMELHIAWMQLMGQLNRKLGSYASMRVEVTKLKKSGEIEKISDSEIPENIRKGKHYLQKSFYRIPQL